MCGHIHAIFLVWDTVIFLISMSHPLSQTFHPNKDDFRIAHIAAKYQLQQYLSDILLQNELSIPLIFRKT